MEHRSACARPPARRAVARCSARAPAAPRIGHRRHDPAEAALPALRILTLAAAPSALLLGITRYLTTDVASVPLLWIVPLALYLATFIHAFAAPRS